MANIDFSTWLAGWTALAFVAAYGVYLAIDVLRATYARNHLPNRIVVTGTRGKSGTVRLIHAALSGGDQRVYAKITGTEAAELDVDGVETETRRFGAAGVSEMPPAMIRAVKQGATVGVFECMAVSPPLIELIQKRMIRGQIVVIPTIRLDHLEEEGLTELEIGMSILKSIAKPRVVVCGVTQPHIVSAFKAYASENGLVIHFTQADSSIAPIPGHHPTNIAVALEVAAQFGVDRETAIERMRAASTEPRAATFSRIYEPDGSHLDLVDLGGANDPESAREAFVACNLPREQVIPVVVNRWERPLRSVSFIGAVDGRFATVGVIGTLTPWSKRINVARLSRKGRTFERTRFIRLPLRSAMTERGIHEWARQFPLEGDSNHRILVLLENTHDPAANAIRRVFERNGTELPFEVSVHDD